MSTLHSAPRGAIRVKPVEISTMMCLCEDINNDAQFFIRYEIIPHYFEGLTAKQVAEVYHVLQNSCDILIDTINWKVFKVHQEYGMKVDLNVDHLLPNDSVSSRMVEYLKSLDDINTNYMLSNREIKPVGQ